MQQHIFSAQRRTIKNGRNMILINTVEGVRWVSELAWLNKGYSLNMSLYDNSTFDVQYYQEGDKLLNGDAYIPQEGKGPIIKEFEVLVNPKISSEIEASLIMRTTADAKLENARWKSSNPRTNNTPNTPVTEPVIEPEESKLV